VGVIADITMPPMFKAGIVIECPVCGQDDELRLTADTSDTSETAAFVKCDAGHQWAEPRVTRRFAAEVCAMLVKNHPEVISWV
jgi:hypothetical protein